MRHASATMLACPLPSPALETAMGLATEPVVVRSMGDIEVVIEGIERAAAAVEAYDPDFDFRRFASDALAECASMDGGE